MADQVADLCPNADFRFLLIDSYSECSDVADQMADLPPPHNADFTDSYSERSYLSDQVFCRPYVLCKRPFTREGNFQVVAMSDTLSN